MAFENFIASMNLKAGEYPALFMLMGIQASGKSTLARELKDSLEIADVSSTIINDDEIYASVLREPKFWRYRSYREVVRAFNHDQPARDEALNKYYHDAVDAQIEQAIASQASIIWDMPNTAGPAKKGRRHFDQDRVVHFNMVAQQGGAHYKRVGIFLDVDFELALQRNVQRGRTVQAITLQRYQDQLKENIPTQDERDWRLFTYREVVPR